MSDRSPRTDPPGSSCRVEQEPLSLWQWVPLPGLCEGHDPACTSLKGCVSLLLPKWRHETLSHQHWPQGLILWKQDQHFPFFAGCSCSEDRLGFGSCCQWTYRAVPSAMGLTRAPLLLLLYLKGTANFSARQVCLASKAPGYPDRLRRAPVTLTPLLAALESVRGHRVLVICDRTQPVLAVWGRTALAALG